MKRIVKIGNQTWMTRNLNVDCFRNGIKIQEAKSLKEWKEAYSNKIPAWCYYDFKRKNGLKYGKIYNWYAVIDSNGLAPNKWRIPYDKDWRELFDFWGGEDTAGLSLKSTTGWNLIDGKGNGNNSSRFNGIPAGLIYNEFEQIGNGAYWWGIVANEKLAAINEKVVTALYYNIDYVECTFTADGGFYIRCLKI